MIFVLGGGFGLYGHVAALAGQRRPVATLARYRPIAQARPELAKLVDRILWVDDEDAALADAELICLARRPADNVAIAITHRDCALVIEKPIAPTVDDAFVAMDALAGRAWAVPYLFLYTDWVEGVREAIACEHPVAIDWVHRPLGSAATWKGDAAQGGGILPFYLIHFVALAQALLPASRLAWCPGGIETDDGLLRINFALGSTPRFILSCSRRTFDAPSPFGALPAAGAPDPRLGSLVRFYHAIGGRAEHAPATAFHRGVLEKWRCLDRQMRER